MNTRRLIVLALGFACCSLSLTAQISMDGQQIRQSPFAGVNSPRGENGSINGTVQDTQNTPLKDVRVDLVEGGGTVVNSTYTNSSGHFEFNHVSPKAYQVIVTSGLQQVNERVDVNGFSTYVNLRVPANTASDGVTIWKKASWMTPENIWPKPWSSAPIMLTLSLCVACWN
jgi:Carboxypeptidase regulatory-like domain